MDTIFKSQKLCDLNTNENSTISDKSKNSFVIQDGANDVIEDRTFAALATCCLIPATESSNYHERGLIDKGISTIN